MSHPLGGKHNKLLGLHKINRNKTCKKQSPFEVSAKVHNCVLLLYYEYIFPKRAYFVIN